MRTLNQQLLFFRVLPAMLTIFLSLFLLVAQAQQKQVRGIVKDAKGSPVPSATVSIKGTRVSAITAADGSFTINAKEGDVLVFTAVSFEAQK